MSHTSESRPVSSDLIFDFSSLLLEKLFSSFHFHPNLWSRILSPWTPEEDTDG